jgi:hypothetical protein
MLHSFLVTFEVSIRHMEAILCVYIYKSTYFLLYLFHFLSNRSFQNDNGHVKRLQ